MNPRLDAAHLEVCFCRTNPSDNQTIKIALCWTPSNCMCLFFCAEKAAAAESCKIHTTVAEEYGGLKLLSVFECKYWVSVLGAVLFNSNTNTNLKKTISWIYNLTLNNLQVIFPRCITSILRSVCAFRSWTALRQMSSPSIDAEQQSSKTSPNNSRYHQALNPRTRSRFILG